MRQSLSRLRLFLSEINYYAACVYLWIARKIAPCQSCGYRAKRTCKHGSLICEDCECRSCGLDFFVKNGMEDIPF